MYDFLPLKLRENNMFKGKVCQWTLLRLIHVNVSHPSIAFLFFMIYIYIGLISADFRDTRRKQFKKYSLVVSFDFVSAEFFLRETAFCQLYRP